MGAFQPLRWSKYVCNAVHGRNLVGDKGAVSPSLFHTGGDIICHVPPLFSLRVFIWRGFKTKCDVCHVSHVDVETEFGVVFLILIFL